MMASMYYKFFDKNTSAGIVESEIMPNQQLAEELYKPIIRKFGKQKVRSSFIDNICGTLLDGIPLISKFDKGFQFLLCVIDIIASIHGLFV